MSAQERHRKTAYKSSRRQAVELRKAAGHAQAHVHKIETNEYPVRCAFASLYMPTMQSCPSPPFRMPNEPNPAAHTDINA